MDEPAPRGVWIASIVAFLVFAAGVFLEQERSTTAIEQREKGHAELYDRQFTLLQGEIDRRFTNSEVAIEKARESIVLAATVGVETKAQIVAMDQNIVALREQFAAGRAERLSSIDGLSKRMDELSLRLGELQRQTSALEGAKLIGDK